MSRDGTATRTRILDAAQQLVLEQGFGGTSVDAVTEAAGTTKGGFYERELFDEVTREAIADACRRWRERTRAKLDEVVALYPPRLEVDLTRSPTRAWRCSRARTCSHARSASPSCSRASCGTSATTSSCSSVRPRRCVSSGR